MNQINKNIKTPRTLQNENRPNRKHRNIIDVLNNNSEKKIDTKEIDFKCQTFRNTNTESSKNLISKSIFLND